jgi:acyl-homoserine lactone acylase PvdQ
MRLRLLCTLLIAALAPAQSGWSGIARKVTITRDRWGVPHIEGPTDASVVFGLLYAQAEDNFWQVEDDIVHGIGRAAELSGRAGVLGDLLNRAFEVNRLARAEYARMSTDARDICDAWAAGLNFYLKSRPQLTPRLIQHYEPWMILAIQLQSAVSRAVTAGRLQRAEIAAAFPELAGLLTQVPEPPSEDEGSNMWAIAPSRSASGKAMLLINPHVAFFGGGQRYEAHLLSKQRLRVSGFAILATPYIRSGFTAKHGWSHTNNNADFADAWFEKFDQPLDPLMYRYGDGWRKAQEWTDAIRVKTDDSTREITLKFRKTHRGPVLAIRNGRPITARVTGHDRGGQLEQRIAFARARNLNEFKQALAMRAIFGSNTMYADAKGNIFYIHGCTLPKRDPAYDWSAVLDGSDPATDWQGYHAIQDFPQFTNPPSGYLQNSNSTPFAAAGGDSLDASRFPPLMSPEPDNARAKNSRRILASRPRFSFDEWAVAALDTSVFTEQEDIAGWSAVWKEKGLAKDLEPLAAELRSWDGVSRNNSVAMTLYVQTRAHSGNLGEVKNALEKLYGTWRVPYGDVFRLQRIHTSGVLEPFSEAKPSVPVPCGPGTLGMICVFNTRRPPGSRYAYGASGNTYVAVIEFARRVRARSLLVFGQSADPKSPHFFDQAPLYSEQRFKEAWFDKRDIRRNAERRYHPGD